MHYGLWRKLKVPNLSLTFDDDIDIVNVLCYINIPNFDQANQMFFQCTNFQSSGWFESKTKQNIAQVWSTHCPDMILKSNHSIDMCFRQC